jgi:hypothetical protein
MQSICNILLKPKFYHFIDSILFYRNKHSNITINSTKMLLIDNSLKKDLEIAKNRKLRRKITNEKEKLSTRIEMSESHDVKPYIK